MLSEAQIARVWEGMLESEMRALYFGELVEYYQNRQRWVSIAGVVASSAAFASFTVQLIPSVVQPYLTLAAAVIGAYGLVAQNNRKAIDSADLHLRWNKIYLEYRMIWENVYSADAEVRLQAVTEKDAEASRAGTSFPNDRKRLARWQRFVESRYTSERNQIANAQA